MYIYSYMFKLKSPSEYSPFDSIHPLRCFSTAQSSFWTFQFWCLLVLLPFFCFTSSTSTKCFPLRTFFHPGKQQQKKSLGERSGEFRGWGMGIMLFLVKNCWRLSKVWAGAFVNHPSGSGPVGWKSLQKNSLKLNAASHNNVSWYTDTDGS